MMAHPTDNAEFGFMDAGPVLDWETVIVMGMLLVIATTVPFVCTRLLINYTGNWRLSRASTLAAGLTFLALCLFIVLTPIVTDHSALADADSVLGLTWEGYGYLYLMVVASWVIAFLTGLRMRRATNSIENNDPTAFD